MREPEVLICPDAATLAFEAAELIVRAAADASAARGRFTLALSGGSTPEATYNLLAALANPDSPGSRSPVNGTGQSLAVGRIDWSRVYLFFGDERCVPHDDNRSNYALAKRSLLSKVPVPADHVFPIPTDLPTPAAAADAYSRTLAQAFGMPAGGAPPRFDLILLGLGDDGHTASLFPHAAALDEERAWVTWSPPGVLPPPVDRVTFTFPTLNAARAVLFLVAGGRKAGVVRDVLEGQPAVWERPSAGVRPTDGTLTWLLDQAAAGLLRR
jgi:6-phosphogluconolactonase